MNIVIGKTAGFCEGVKNAVEHAKIETESANGKMIYCLGDLVHNPQVLKKLKNKGLRIIETLSEIPNPDGKKVIFRAHGIAKNIYEEAEKLGLIIIDLTCPNVLAIHKITEQYAKNNYNIFLIGEKEHPEVIGSASFCGKNYQIIEDDKDLKNAIKNVKDNNVTKLLIISQTTFNLEKFEGFTKIIEEELRDIVEIKIKNTICRATRLRQEETEKMAKEMEYMIVIGGKKSSNTNKLYDISSENCKNAVMIENETELEENTLNKIKKYNKIGIMAGASTPQEDIETVKQKIENN